MTEATYNTVIRLVEGKRGTNIADALIGASGNTERELEMFLDELKPDIRDEIVALMCLGQDARKNRAYLKNGDSRPEDWWKPLAFEAYRQEARRCTFDYFASKPLLEYIELGRDVVELYEMDTTPILSGEET